MNTQMAHRPYKDTPSAELEERLHKLFAENKDLFEELAVRRWNVEIHLPTDGLSSAFGYAPSQLARGAGFRVTRSLSPCDIKRHDARKWIE